MNDYDKFRPLLEANKAILVIGEVSTGEDKPKIFPQEIMPLATRRKNTPSRFTLRLHAAHLQPEDWPGSSNSSPRIQANARCCCASCARAAERFSWTRTSGSASRLPLELERAANKLFGEETYYAKVDLTLPEKTRRSWEKKNGSNGGGEE